MRIQRFRRKSAGMLVFAQSSTSSYSRDPMPRSAAASIVWIPLRLLTLTVGYDFSISELGNGREKEL